MNVKRYGGRAQGDFAAASSMGYPIREQKHRQDTGIVALALSGEGDCLHSLSLVRQSPACCMLLIVSCGMILSQVVRENAGRCGCANAAPYSFASSSVSVINASTEFANSSTVI